MATIRPALLSLVALVFASPALAGPVNGSGLGISITPAGVATLTYTSKDYTVDSGNFGSTGDPRCDADGGGGGSIRVNGGPGNDITIVLPCAGWQTNGSPTNVFGPDYVYKDKTGATCSKVILKHGKMIQVKCRGPQVAYTLGSAQGTIDVTLRLGSEPLLSCSTFGPPPTAVIRDGSDGRKYLAKRAPEPASCTSP